MNAALRVIDSGFASPQEHMHCDAALLAELSPDSPIILRFYKWPQESITFGHFLNPDLLLDAKGVGKYCIQMARRPTGGGLLFHYGDLAFSLLVPATHPRLSLNSLHNYAWINGAVLSAVEQFLGRNHRSTLAEMGTARAAHCMAHPTRYDVLISGKKVAGAAQRRTRKGLLHQGSIFLSLPPQAFVQEVVQDGERVWESMCAVSAPLLSGSAIDLQSGRHALQQLLAQQF